MTQPVLHAVLAAVVAPAAPLLLLSVLVAVTRTRRPEALADAAVRRRSAILLAANGAVWLGFAGWLVVDRAAIAADERSADGIRCDRLTAIHRRQTALTTGIGAASVALSFLDRDGLATADVIAAGTLLAIASGARAIGANLSRDPFRV